MENHRSVNSSVEVGTSAPGTCACCHHKAQVKKHWDVPEVLLCGPCRALIFTLEANGDLAHLAYAYWTNVLQAGGR